jgi:hypothetical protein
VIAGAGDGIGRGLEFFGHDNPSPSEVDRFRVGVVANGWRTHRAVKWVDAPRAFAVDWHEGVAERSGDVAHTTPDGVETPLFGGPPEETVDLLVDVDGGTNLDVVTRDVHGVEYLSTMVRSPGTQAIWSGVQHWTDWQGQPQMCKVTMAWIEARHRGHSAR